jgi:transmembrane sensor
MTLGTLVEILNRQGGIVISAPPAALAAIPIMGRFRTDRPAALLSVIGKANGFDVRADQGILRFHKAL